MLKSPLLFAGAFSSRGLSFFKLSEVTTGNSEFRSYSPGLWGVTDTMHV